MKIEDWRLMQALWTFARQIASAEITNALHITPVARERLDALFFGGHECHDSTPAVLAAAGGEDTCA